MKRWALLTVALYLVCMSILCVPILLILKDKADDLFGFHFLFAPVLVLVQVVLLLVPVSLVHERPISRRTVITSAIIVAIPMGALALGIYYSLIFMMLGESDKYWYTWRVLLIPALGWLSWGVIFYRNYLAEQPGSFTVAMTRWLLRGSILELIVAVPSHIISRQRHYCCAPGLTLMGIATGVAVALLSFGPGIFFLFARKINEKNRKTAA